MELSAVKGISTPTMFVTSFGKPLVVHSIVQDILSGGKLAETLLVCQCRRPLHGRNETYTTVSGSIVLAIGSHGKSVLS